MDICGADSGFELVRSVVGVVRKGTGPVALSDHEGSEFISDAILGPN